MYSDQTPSSGSMDDGDPTSTNLYLGNLAPTVTEEALQVRIQTGSKASGKQEHIRNIPGSAFFLEYSFPFFFVSSSLFFFVFGPVHYCYCWPQDRQPG